MGRVCKKSPPLEHHGPYAVPVHTRLPTPALPMDGRVLGGSSCRPLVPGERECGIQLTSTSSGQCGEIRTSRMPARSNSHLPPWRPGMVIHPRSVTPPALQEAESPLYWSVRDPEADQRGHEPAPTTPQVSNSPHVPRFSTRTMLFSHSEPDKPPPPEILDQPSVYQVHNIMDSRRRGGWLEYSVDWEGYGPEERSWVPWDDILDPLLLQEFHCIYPDHPAARSRGRLCRHIKASGASG